MEKTVEFDNIKELSKCEIFDDKKVTSTQTHYDKGKKKYITKVEYGK